MNKGFDPRGGGGGAPPRATYEGDYSAWALEQAALLRAGRLSEIDAANIAEELEDVAKSEYWRLRSALRVLLMHMLKWDHEPGRRGRSWEATIRTQRRHALGVLKESPSLKARLEETLGDAYEDARSDASGETDLPLRTFPESLPYGWDEILNRPFEFDPPPPPAAP